VFWALSKTVTKLREDNYGCHKHHLKQSNHNTKVALEPGTKITLEHNGAPLTAAQLDGKSLAVTKSGDSLMVTMPDGSQTELVDFFITEDVTLDGDFWEIPADGGLTQTASGVIAQPTTLARAVDAGVLGEEAIATDVSATEITEAVAAVVAETEPAVGAGGFGGVLAGLAGLGLAAGGGGTLTDVTVNEADAKIYTATFTPDEGSTAAAINTVGTQTAVIGGRCSLQSRCAMAIKF
jgi:hypothetical protein